MEKTPQQIAADEHDRAQYQTLNQVVKKYGGRHLIFRTEAAGLWFVPTPCALISSFRGLVWAFYGIGQVWLTHKKTHKIGGWMARMPRFGGGSIQLLVDNLETELTDFIEYCNETGIEGTVVVENKVIEFHWTFGFELQHESSKAEHCEELDRRFKALVDSYLTARDKT